MKPVKLGLVGLGEWPRQAYVPILKELDAARVVAVAARSPATQQFAREQFGRQIALHGDYPDLLRDDNVEAVMLALPNRLHAEGMTAALASGKHLFYEPPIAQDEEVARRLLRTMEGSDRVIRCNLELRYLPVIRAVGEHLASGTIGTALMAKIRLWCDWGFGGVDWTPGPEEEGFFTRLGVWYLDVLDALFETTPVRASVVGGYAANETMMDHGWATLEYPHGQIGQHEFSLVAVEGLDIRLSVLGTKGEIEADLCSGQCRWRGPDGTSHKEHHRASQPAHGFVGMRESIVDFLGAVAQGWRSRTDVEVARRVHAAVLASARSEAENATVAVDPLY